MRRLLLALWSLPLVLDYGRAQDVRIFSEFRRPGPRGEIVAADQEGRPREILSPAVVRNGHTTFHVVVKAAPEDKITLYVTSNPTNIVRSTIYRQFFSEKGLPERLEALKEPVHDQLEAGIGVFLLDLFIPKSAPVRRIRYEVQLHSKNRWNIFPLELRVLGATVPDQFPIVGDLAAAGDPSSSTAFSALRSYLCGHAQKASAMGLSQRPLIRRNASQDVAIAREIEKTKGLAYVRNGIAQSLGAADAPAWCAAELPRDPERYLRARDFLIRAGSP
jgi:hypothetical protein